MSDAREAFLQQVMNVITPLFAGEEPDRIFSALTDAGMPYDNAENLLRVAGGCAEAAVRIAQESSNAEQEADAIAEWGIDKNLVIALLARTMPLAKMTAPPQEEETMREEDLQQIVRLAIVVRADAAQGTDAAVIAETIAGLEQLADSPYVRGHERAFVDHVLLAEEAASRIRKGEPADVAMLALGLEKKPAYAALLAAFFAQEVTPDAEADA